MIRIKTFGERLKHLRGKTTQPVVSKKIGIHVNTLRKYERDKGLPNANELIRIKNFYNVSYEYLLGETDVQSVNTNIQAIHKYTGLSENAIKTLKALKTTNAPIILTLNFLLDQQQSKYFLELLLALHEYSSLNSRVSKTNPKLSNYTSFFHEIAADDPNSNISSSNEIEYISLFKVTELTRRVANECKNKEVTKM